MDYCLSNSYLGQLYLTSWEEYYTGMFPVNLKYFIFLTVRVLGQLFLGYFSGPVEGIIMIVIIFTITGFYGLKLTRFFVILYLLN